jgi:hypothetical protein
LIWGAQRGVSAWKKEAAMRARLSEVVLGLTLVLAASACQEDEPKAFSPGVDRNKPLGMVTPAEAQAICSATQAWSRDAVAQEKQRLLACRVTAILAAAGGAGLGGAGGLGNVDQAQLQATCKAAYDTCLATPEPTGNEPIMCESFPASCTATVGEYEACLTEVPAFVDRTLPSLPTCETLNLISLLGLANLINTVPEPCKTFQMKCQGASIGGIPPIGGPVTTPP